MKIWELIWMRIVHRDAAQCQEAFVKRKKTQM